MLPSPAARQLSSRSHCVLHWQCPWLFERPRRPRGPPRDCTPRAAGCCTVDKTEDAPVPHQVSMICKQIHTGGCTHYIVGTRIAVARGDADIVGRITSRDRRLRSRRRRNGLVACLAVAESRPERPFSFVPLGLDALGLAVAQHELGARQLGVWPPRVSTRERARWRERGGLGREGVEEEERHHERHARRPCAWVWTRHCASV